MIDYTLRCYSSGCKSTFYYQGEGIYLVKNRAIEFGWRIGKEGAMICPACYKYLTEEPKLQTFTCNSFIIPCGKAITCKSTQEAIKDGWGFYYGVPYCPSCLAYYNRPRKSPITLEKFAANLSDEIRKAYLYSTRDLADIIDKAIKVD